MSMTMAASIWLDATDPRPTEDWELPLEMIEEMHRDRIDPEFDVQPFTVEAWNAGEAMPTWSVVIAGGTDDTSPRDLALHAAKVMVEVAHPDYLVVALDTHMTSVMTNPNTGKPWGPGEMQNACDQDGACLTGIIRDNLVVHTLRLSDGKTRMRCFPYHVEEDKSITRFDEQVLSEWEPGFHFEGIFADAFAEFTASWADPQSLWAMMSVVAKASDFTPRRARLHTVLAGVKLLNETSMDLAGRVGLFEHSLLAHGQDDMEVIAESFRRQATPMTEEEKAAVHEAAEALTAEMRDWVAEAENAKAEAENAKAGE